MMPQEPLVAIGRPVLAFGDPEEDHLEGRYPDQVVSLPKLSAGGRRAAL